MKEDLDAMASEMAEMSRWDHLGWTPTEQQKKVFEVVADTTSNAIIEARAGTGKTTTIVAAADLVPTSRFVAFNRSIAQELGRKLPPSCKASTMHSMGFQAVRGTFGNVDVDTKGEKVKESWKRHVHNASEWSWPMGPARNLVSLCKSYMVMPETGYETSVDDLVDRFDLDFHEGRYGHGIDREVEVREALPDVMQDLAFYTERIDFDDMIWLPVVRDLRVPTSPVLFVDEAQDLNPTQIELCLRASKGGRMVAVGDPFQSIYGFRGADSRAMQNIHDALQERPGGVEKLYLTTTFRCPRRVVETAQSIVPDYHAMDGADEGTVEVVHDPTDTLQRGDMVLCRVNAPLMGMAYELLLREVPVQVQGRDFAKGLKRFIRSFKAHSVEELLRDVDDFRREEVEKLLRAERRQRAQVIEDKCFSVAALSEGLGTVDDVVSRIDRIFEDVKEGEDHGGVVLLSTVHKAKGLEAPRVFIMNPELMPHPMAQRGWEFQQEMNVAYVAVTRAMQALYFVNDVPPAVSGDVTGGEW